MRALVARYCCVQHDGAKRLAGHFPPARGTAQFPAPTDRRRFRSNERSLTDKFAGAKFMPYWLMKSEPDELSIHDLQRLGKARWDGVRNYQARNFMRAMQRGDLFFFYHSSCPQPGIAGIARIAGEVYPDPTALDPQSHYHDPKASPEKNPWSALDVEFVEAFDDVLTLQQLKNNPLLADLALVQRGSRLSVMPVTEAEWTAILAMR
jgi:predicted RNA-binding protein with PUA-like domain